MHVSVPGVPLAEWEDMCVSVQQQTGMCFLFFFPHVHPQPAGNSTDLLTVSQSCHKVGWQEVLTTLWISGYTKSIISVILQGSD